jgi:addiction module HigA family antidote
MRNPPHPGRLVRQECIEALGLTVTEAAQALGVTRQALNNVVNENAGISPEMAIRLESAFGSTADTWLSMQATYDLAQARKKKIKIQRSMRNIQGMNGNNDFRHFVDQWFCYKNGYVNANGGAKWEGILWHESVSIAAQATQDRRKVLKEHVVPLARITKELEKLADSDRTSLDDIEQCLIRYVHFATVTKDEDKLLRDANLDRSMPAGFDIPGDPLYGDIFARYRHVGIVLGS